MTGRVHNLLQVGTTGRTDEVDLSRGVDLVGEDVLCECLADSLVEANKQLSQCLAIAAPEHGQRVMIVGGHGDAADGIHFAEGDFAVVYELGDMRQRHDFDSGVLGWAWVYAAGWFTTDRFGAAFHGSSSSMRVMG